MTKDSELIGRSIQDVIVEPARKHLIPGFSKVKNNALNAGALGVTISGAGPSVIAFCKKSQNLKKIGKSMEKGFNSVKVNCDIIICKPSARVLRLELEMKKAVVVFSGGIDSVSTCAYLKPKYELYGISFLYGQKANQEIKKAKVSLQKSSD